MTSSGPYTQSYNFTHMYNLVDYRGCFPKKSFNDNSLTGIIKKHPDFTKFAYILKLANMEDIYNSPQANFTVFVPSDQTLSNLNNDIFINMDSSFAKHFIKASTLDRIITSELLSDSPASYFVTRSLQNKLFISNINDVIKINNNINVIHKDMKTDNGLIHVIDGLISPLVI
jgi:uncharacterized surface protein with fasciclin (FAS1) repeats